MSHQTCGTLPLHYSDRELQQCAYEINKNLTVYFIVYLTLSTSITILLKRGKWYKYCGKVLDRVQFIFANFI